jgi:hypothetical protein
MNALLRRTLGFDLEEGWPNELTVEADCHDVWAVIANVRVPGGSSSGGRAALAGWHIVDR